MSIKKIALVCVFAFTLLFNTSVSAVAARSIYISDEISSSNPSAGLQLDSFASNWKSGLVLQGNTTGCTVSHSFGNITASPDTIVTSLNIGGKTVGIDLMNTTGVTYSTFTINGTQGKSESASGGMQDGSPIPTSAMGQNFWNEQAGSSSSPNAVRFSFGNTGVDNFGIFLGDLETRSDQTSNAKMIIVYTDNTSEIVSINPGLVDGTIINQTTCGGTNQSNSLSGCGNETTRFVGVNVTSGGIAIKEIYFLVGDDDSGDDGNTEHMSFINPMISTLNCSASSASTTSISLSTTNNTSSVSSSNTSSTMTVATSATSIASVSTTNTSSTQSNSISASTSSLTTSNSTSSTPTSTSVSTSSVSPSSTTTATNMACSTGNTSHQSMIYCYKCTESLSDGNTNEVTSTYSCSNGWTSNIQLNCLSNSTSTTSSTQLPTSSTSTSTSSTVLGSTTCFKCTDVLTDGNVNFADNMSSCTSGWNSSIYLNCPKENTSTSSSTAITTTVAQNINCYKCTDMLTDGNMNYVSNDSVSCASGWFATLQNNCIQTSSSSTGTSTTTTGNTTSTTSTSMTSQPSNISCFKCTDNLNDGNNNEVAMAIACEIGWYTTIRTSCPANSSSTTTTSSSSNSCNCSGVFNTSICWNNVITTMSGGSYYWMNSCKGNTPTCNISCAMGLTSLTNNEVDQYLSWLNAGSPMNPSCNPVLNCSTSTTTSPSSTTISASSSNSVSTSLMTSTSYSTTQNNNITCYKCTDMLTDGNTNYVGEFILSCPTEWFTTIRSNCITNISSTTSTSTNTSSLTTTGTTATSTTTASNLVTCYKCTDILTDGNMNYVSSQLSCMNGWIATPQLNCPTNSTSTTTSSTQSGSVLGEVTSVTTTNTSNPMSQVCGKIFLDKNNNTKLDTGDISIPNVTISLKDYLNNNYTTNTNSNGDYCISILSGQVIATVDLNDPDLKLGCGNTINTTTNYNQVLSATQNSTVVAGNVGFYRNCQVLGASTAATTQTGQVKGLSDTGADNLFMNLLFKLF